MGKKTSWGEGGWIAELTMEGKRDSGELKGSEIQGKWKLEVEEEAQDHSSSSSHRKQPPWSLVHFFQTTGQGRDRQQSHHANGKKQDKKRQEEERLCLSWEACVGKGRIYSCSFLAAQPILLDFCVFWKRALCWMIFTEHYCSSTLRRWGSPHREILWRIGIPNHERVLFSQLPTY